MIILKYLKLATLFLISLVNVAIVSSQSIFTKEDLKMFLDSVENARKTKQSEILTINDLCGTYWIPDDSDINTRCSQLQRAYIFLNDVVIIARTDPYTFLPEISDNVMFWIMFINDAIKFKIVNERILLTEKWSCYIEDTYLYVGDESYGFVKYRLEGTFPILDFSE
jgi:hypothetical protein